MADLKYSVDIDTKRASNALGSLQSTIVGFGAAIAGAFTIKEFTQTAGKLEDLRKTLETLYGSVEKGAGAFKDLQGLSDTLGVDINTLAESVIKLKAAGIEPTAAQLRLFADTASVSTDKIGALTAMTDLFTRTMAGGLGLEDLERLQDRGIPVYDILRQKLGLARNEIVKYGQSAAGAELIRQKLTEGLNERFGGAAADRADTLSAAMTRLGNSFKTAADTAGQAGLSAAISDIADYTSKWIKNNQDLIKSISVNLALAFKLLLDNIGVISKAMLILFGTIMGVKAISAIKNLISAFGLLSKALMRNPLMLVAAALIAAASAAGLLDGAFKAMNEQFDKMVGSALTPELDKIKVGLDETGTSTEGLVIQQGKLATSTGNVQSQLNALNEQLTKFKVEMGNVTKEFARQNEETRKNLDLDTQLIGASALVAAQKRADAEISAKLADEIAKLQQAKAKLTEQEKKEGRGAVIDATIKKLEQQAEADRAATAEAVKNSQLRQQAYQLEQFKLQSTYNVQDQIAEIQKKIAQSTMSDIERGYDDITRAAQRNAEAAIRAEEARIGRPLNTAERKKYYDTATAGVRSVLAEQQRLNAAERDFTTGWTRAWKQYSDDATNAAKTAQEVFTKATQGMEDAFVNFAKTGKFEFKSFVSSILETLLRSQIQQTLARVFNIGGLGGGGGGGSFLGSIGKLLGFANGGIIPTNAPVVVGEKGPELLVGAKGNRVIPNNQLGGGTVVYNINAVDAPSFQALVARDPGFIHAVAMAGAGQMAGRR